MPRNWNVPALIRVGVAFGTLAAGTQTGAQTSESQLILQASTDGEATWSSRVDVVPGATVYVRVRAVVRDYPQGLGLAGVTHQPTLSNWDPALGDVRVPFSFFAPDTDYVGRPVTNAPGRTGRILPFGSAGQGSGSGSGLLTSFNDPGNVLRFAGSKAATMTTNLAWGVGSAQQPMSLSGTNFNPGLDVVIFKYAVTLSASNTAERTLLADVPLEGVQNGRISWYVPGIGFPPPTLVPTLAAQIHVVPSPSSVFAIVIVCGFRFGRKRAMT